MRQTGHTGKTEPQGGGQAGWPSRGSAVYARGMIIRPRPSGLVLFYAMRGSVLPIIAPRLAVILAISLGVVLLHHYSPQYFTAINPAPFTLLGLGLSIFIGFRNNTCYDRWWEGRKLWGTLVAESRVLLRLGRYALQIRLKIAHVDFIRAHDGYHRVTVLRRGGGCPGRGQGASSGRLRKSGRGGEYGSNGNGG